MKIHKDRFTDITSEEEQAFLGTLKWCFREVLSLNTSQLSVILEKLGIKVPVRVKTFKRKDQELILQLETGDVIEFFMGYTMTLYPVIRFNDEEWLVMCINGKVTRMRKI